MPEQNIKTVDKNAAKFDVKYVEIYPGVKFPKEAWEAWSKEQQTAYLDELKRQEQ
jgi:hypothetical protein